MGTALSLEEDSQEVKEKELAASGSNLAATTTFQRVTTFQIA